ncbi:MAG: carotenoid oxygenase family protein [Natronomonas sp.]
MSSSRAYELGFQSLDVELSNRRLPVDGEIPSWLSGALIHNGPGRFEIGGERVTHWFDGLGMLRRYGFEDGSVYFSNRFLRTDARRRALDGDRSGEFATAPGLIELATRWIRSLGPPEPTDNANVHVARFDDRFVALTEAPRAVEFDPNSLETRGAFEFTDDIETHLRTAHLASCPDGTAVGLGLRFGRTSRYHVFEIPPNSTERNLLATIPADGPGYVHDIAATAEHVVFVEPPLRIALSRVLKPGNDGLLDALVYDDTRQSRIVVVDRADGSVVVDETIDPFFVFHHINAYEAADRIVLDSVTFEDADILDALTLDALGGDAFELAPPGQYERFEIGLDGSISRRRCHTGGLELPTVTQSVRGRKHRYVYAQATDRQGANGLLKFDSRTESATEWWSNGVYVEEPQMIQRPDAEGPDDGVVLAPALDTDAKRTTLLVFDAETLSLRARAPLPHAVPFGFHSRFFEDLPATT